MLVMTIIQRRRSCTVTTSGMEDTEEDGAAWLGGRGNGALVETEDSPGTKEIQTDIDRDKGKKETV